MSGIEADTHKGYSFLDTNVRFDIIYPQRPRHIKAVDFYKRFKNLELCIENIVNKEANKVTLTYASNFGTDLIRFLESEEKHSQKWDELSRERRIKRIQDFISQIRGQYTGSDVFPFYMALINSVQTILPDYEFSELREYTIELPNYLLVWLRINIRTRFSLHIPSYDANDESVRRFQQELNKLMRDGYFEKEQSEDVLIFINLLLLLIVGGVGGISVKEYGDLLYYTEDQPALKSYVKFQSKAPSMKEKEYDEWLKRGLAGVKAEVPY